MSQLEYPDLHYVRAAQGWIELGFYGEAAVELRKLSAPAHGHPDVLDLRWQLAAHQQRWDAALEIAQLLIQRAPDRPSGWIHQSYALHELRRTHEAWDALLPTSKRFPNDGTIAYNLACYACQLGDLGVAREWVHRAIKLRGKNEIKAMAANDADLKPLQPWLGTL